MNDKPRTLKVYETGVGHPWIISEDDEGYTIERDVGPFRLIVRQREAEEIEGLPDHFENCLHLNWVWHLMAYTRMSFSEKGEMLERDSVSVLQGHAIDREIAMSVGLVDGRLEEGWDQDGPNDARGRCDEDGRRLMDLRMPQSGQWWRHHKGGLYQVRTLAYEEETGNVPNGDRSSRPLDEWLGKVPDTGPERCNRYEFERDKGRRMIGLGDNLASVEDGIFGD